eukprot:887246-Prymnesium_polylepis.1
MGLSAVDFSPIATVQPTEVCYLVRRGSTPNSKLVQPFASIPIAILPFGRGITGRWLERIEE